MTFHVIFLGEIQYIYVNDSKAAIPLSLFQDWFGKEMDVGVGSVLAYHQLATMFERFLTDPSANWVEDTKK